MAPWSTRPFSSPPYAFVTEELRQERNSGVLDRDGSLETGVWTIIVSEAFINNWPNFPFVKKLVTQVAANNRSSRRNANLRPK
jgi:hypothetical protein